MRSYGQFCTVAKALDVVGDRWTLLIVRELLMQGPCRYTDLQRGLPGIATNLLSTRLRELEETGVVSRQSAPPPVATTLFSLTEAGRELEPVLRALATWGTRLMVAPSGDEVFRSHWFAYPVSMVLADSDPGGLPATIELRTGDDPAVIEVSEGQVRTRVGSVPDPDLVLGGPAPLILGLIVGFLTFDQALEQGLTVTGDRAVLTRLQRPRPLGALATAPSAS